MFEQPFTKENLDQYLKELAKEFRKINGKNMPADIILIGGASVVINYGFREMTYDMDAVINAASSMKDAINHVGDKFNLPNGWLNTDFMKTTSYTPKIVRYSKFYRTFFQYCYFPYSNRRIPHSNETYGRSSIQIRFIRYYRHLMGT